jgi:hypothetical protein
MLRSRLLSIAAAALIVTAGTAYASNGKNFGTHLHGDEEVPARATRAQGQATFQLSPDGSELSYKLNVANIDNVFQAHLHKGVAGTNGPIVVWLYPSTAPVPGPLGGGAIQGRIADGTITVADLTGAGDITTMAQLIAAIEAGEIYVNVHTNDGVAPTNSGPGDFPGGELRGQLP